ncbi:hypothetical protein V6N13_058342 [Hibiscus sabdariffa]|uniref:Uncharacterized protein n=1 Tax=Hibiscus sabdariffa TaxID=183260 RepID=A0ABR2GGE5_9ROSI
MGQGYSSSSIRHDGDLTLASPDECLALIFGKLGCHDRNNYSLVYMRWNHVDSKSRQRLVLVARTEISLRFPSLFARFSLVSVLSLKCSRKLVSVDDDALARIPTLLPSLKKLKLKGCVGVLLESSHLSASASLTPRALFYHSNIKKNSINPASMSNGTPTMAMVMLSSRGVRETGIRCCRAFNLLVLALLRYKWIMCKWGIQALLQSPAPVPPIARMTDCLPSPTPAENFTLMRGAGLAARRSGRRASCRLQPNVVAFKRLYSWECPSLSSHSMPLLQAALFRKNGSL